MLALPIIPPTVSSPFANMKDYFEQTGKWCICQIGSEDLVINSSTNFISLVPYAATFPFEIWIVPRYHFEHFHELDAEKAIDLGGLLKLISSFLKGESKTSDFLIFMKVELFYFYRLHFKKPFVRQ